MVLAAGCFWMFCDYTEYQKECYLNGGKSRGVLGNTCVFNGRYNDGLRLYMSEHCPSKRGWYVVYEKFWRHTCA